MSKGATNLKLTSFFIYFCSFYEGCLGIVACSVYVHIFVSQTVRKLGLLQGVCIEEGFEGERSDVWNKMQQCVLCICQHLEFVCKMMPLLRCSHSPLTSSSFSSTSFRRRENV
jgi:hypothetical protein